MKLVGVDPSIYGTTETISKTLSLGLKNLKDAKLLYQGNSKRQNVIR